MEKKSCSLSSGHLNLDWQTWLIWNNLQTNITSHYPLSSYRPQVQKGHGSLHLPLDLGRSTTSNFPPQEMKVWSLYPVERQWLAKFLFSVYKFSGSCESVACYFSFGQAITGQQGGDWGSQKSSKQRSQVPVNKFQSASALWKEDNWKHQGSGFGEDKNWKRQEHKFYFETSSKIEQTGSRAVQKSRLSNSKFWAADKLRQNIWSGSRSFKTWFPPDRRFFCKFAGNFRRKSAPLFRGCAISWVAKETKRQTGTTQPQKHFDEFLTFSPAWRSLIQDNRTWQQWEILSNTPPQVFWERSVVQCFKIHFSWRCGFLVESRSIFVGKDIKSCWRPTCRILTLRSWSCSFFFILSQVQHTQVCQTQTLSWAVVKRWTRLTLHETTQPKIF